jgi:hypothetical protein
MASQESDDRRRPPRHRAPDNPADVVNGHLSRYSKLYFVLAWVLLPVLTNLANRVIGSAEPVTRLQAQQKDLRDSVRLAQATADRTQSEIRIHAQNDSGWRAQQERVNQVLILSQCFDRTSGELAILERLAALNCAGVRRSR